MKNNIKLYLIVFFVGITFQVYAQALYKHGIGATIGTTQALSYKTFITNHFAIQIDAGTKYCYVYGSHLLSVELAPNFMFEGRLIKNLYGFLGLGGSVGYTVLRRTPFVPIVRLISVTPHNIYVGYIFYCLKSTTLDSNGAAQQQITIPMIRNKEITIPSKGILELFESQTEPIFNQIDILKEQIRLLTEARDRLLPKLMSGEIELDGERPERPTTS